MAASSWGPVTAGLLCTHQAESRSPREVPTPCPTGRPPSRTDAVSPQPFFGGSASINQISGRIASGDEVLAHLSGRWVRGRPGAWPGGWGMGVAWPR